MCSISGHPTDYAFLSKEEFGRVSTYLKGKNVLVTGGTGSFGNAFISVLLQHFQCNKIIVFSRDELKQSVMKQKFPDSKYPSMRYLLGDVRDRGRLDRAFKGVDVIIHAAALKQVPALEYNPTEAVKTNIFGAMNISQAAVDAGVKKIVALSTDKAAAPINLYGATKLCSDKLFVAAQNMAGSKDVAFSVVRYGNVFGSRGSIVPVLHRLRASGKAKITDERMSRFNISLNEAVNFVLSAITESRGGEIFVPKLKSYQLGKVFEAVVPECEVTVIGRRPGEKLHELMVPADEAYRTVDIGDRYIIEPDTFDASRNPTYQRRLNDKSGVKVPDEFGYDSGKNTDWCTVEELRAQYRQWCVDYGYEIPAVVAEGATQGSAKKQRTE